MHQTAAVRARNITKTFGDVIALDGVDLDVAAGQIHGLVGPNGAGKTTLLGLLLGLARADGGRLEILGASAGRALAVTSGATGFVDGPGLYPTLTARQNLTTLATLRGEEGGGSAGVADVLERVEKVAAATPMFGAFQSKPDFTPYTARANRVSLTENIATPPACGLDTPTGPQAAAKARNVPSTYVSSSQAWEKWSTKQRLTGRWAQADHANPEQFNRWTWYQTHHWDLPYPGDTKIYLPNEVPGAALPGADTD